MDQGKHHIEGWTSFAPFPRHAGLYAVVPSLEWVSKLAEANVPVVQLRDKRADFLSAGIAVH